ncbi:hypothetical protein KAT08_02595 [Candidatus Babeliales bacterium]|nr:hypothetical protein [Candidatus Babeliales bacterium]
MKLLKKYFNFLILIIFVVSVSECVSKKKRGGEEEVVASEKTPKRVYISSQHLLESSFKLANLIFASDFRPTFLIALWRGGAPIGMVVEEYFSYKKSLINKHVTVRTSAYDNGKLKNNVEIFDLDYVIRTIKNEDKLLIVDDIIDSGSTVKAILEEIKKRCGSNTPNDIKVATVYYKPKKSLIIPDYYLYETDYWIVFPHSVEGMTIPEIDEVKGSCIAQLLK